MQITRFILWIAVCLFLSSCVTSQTDVDALGSRMRAMERNHQEEMQSMHQMLEDYQVRLEMVDEKASQAGGAFQTTQASLWADVESLRTHVATLTGRLDSLEREYAQTRQQRVGADQTLSRLESKTRELDRSLHMISSQLGMEIAETEPRAVQDSPSLDPSPAPVQEPGPAPIRADSAQALYQQALDSFYDRDYELAQSLWEEFTDNFPDHALTSNAYFWQGESFYQMQKYAQAALAYQEVITNFPDSNKINSSMLKQGMSFFHLGREEAGELVLSELVKRFPDTAEARRARAFMSDQQ